MKTETQRKLENKLHHNRAVFSLALKVSYFVFALVLLHYALCLVYKMCAIFLTNRKLNQNQSQLARLC